MTRASKFFSDFEKQRIEEAIAAAEAKTSAEIVPAVATESGHYDRAEDIVGLWFGIVAMAIVWFVVQIEQRDVAMWGPQWSRYEPLFLVLAIIGGFLVGAILSGRIGRLRRIFTPRRQMQDEVEAAAHSLFYDQRVHHTAGSTGLLIYVSIFERTATLIADQTVLDSLGKPAIEELCQKLTKGIAGGDAATAFCEVIKEAGERLASLLPRKDSDRNELANALIILD